MVIKLKILKAYDKLEWSFLKAMIQKLGFDNVWISMIMTCVLTVSYAVMVNGQPNSMITPFRGIFKGTPFLHI